MVTWLQSQTCNTQGHIYTTFSAATEPAKRTVAHGGILAFSVTVAETDHGGERLLSPRRSKSRYVYQYVPSQHGCNQDIRGNILHCEKKVS